MNRNVAVTDRQQTYAQHPAQPDGVGNLGIEIAARLATLWHRDGDINQIHHRHPPQRLIQHRHPEGEFQFDSNHQIAIDTDDVAFADLATDGVAGGLQMRFDRRVEV